MLVLRGRAISLLSWLLLLLLLVLLLVLQSYVAACHIKEFRVAFVKACYLQLELQRVWQGSFRAQMAFLACTRVYNYASSLIAMYPIIETDCKRFVGALNVIVALQRC